ncbi:hypothetical protein [Hydrogenimonas sp.]
MKKCIIFGTGVFAALLSASQLVQLSNGKYALLEPSGKWEEVTVVKKEGKTIVLKKDGTWMQVQEPTEESSLQTEGGNTVAVLPQTSKLPPFAASLIGRWSTTDGSRTYVFDKNFRFTSIQDGEEVTADFTVVGYDKKKRVIRIGIGKRFKIGPASFGGKIIKLRFSKDGKVIEDLTNTIEEMKEIKLYKVE